MPPLCIDAQLRFIQRNKGHILVNRHGFCRAQQPAGIGRQDFFLPRDQADMTRAFDPHHTIINFARQKPQGKAHDAAGMRTQPLYGQMRLARICRPKHGRYRRTVKMAHKDLNCPLGPATQGANHCAPMVIRPSGQPLVAKVWVLKRTRPKWGGGVAKA